MDLADASAREAMPRASKATVEQTSTLQQGQVFDRQSRSLAEKHLFGKALKFDGKAKKSMNAPPKAMPDAF
ncbi:MAG TPA: hypothetical protein VN699_11520 [Pirellulales bacterium]|nr:hypothetical protein [Pirellulales bacterium]